MPEKTIRVYTGINELLIDEEIILTPEIEGIVADLAIAVALYVQKIVKMTQSQTIKMATRIIEMLPKEGNWRACVRNFFAEVEIPNAMYRLNEEGSFNSEFDIMWNCDEHNSWLDIAIWWRRSRAELYSFLGTGSGRPINKVSDEHFAHPDWWWSVAECLRDQGEKKAAEAVLADPYYAVIREEHRLVMAVMEATHKSLV